MFNESRYPGAKSSRTTSALEANLCIIFPPSSDSMSKVILSLEVLLAQKYKLLSG